MPWNLNASSDWISSTLKTHLNVEYYDSLDSDYKNMVEDAKYYLGSIGMNDYGASTYYNLERGENTSWSSKIVLWIGKIALMYPSDNYYIYELGVDDICFLTKNCSTDQGVNGDWIFNVSYNFRFLNSFSGN